jgi:hypothetical protein
MSMRNWANLLRGSFMGAMGLIAFIEAAISTIIGFVGSHLQMKNTLEKAKSGMDAASKAAQAEALSKSKTNAKAATSKTETTQPATSTKSPEPEKPAPVKAAGLFDPPLAPPAVAAQSDSDEDDEPSLENDEDDAPVAETEELDDAAWRLLDVLSPRLQTASGRHKTILGHSDSRTSGFGWRTGMFSSTVNPVPGNTLLSSDAVGKHRPAFRY